MTPAQAAKLAALVTPVLGAAVTPEYATALLAQQAAKFGIDRHALFAALSVVMSHPPGLDGASGPATFNVIRLNQARRGQFVVAAASRLTGEVAAARSRGANIASVLQAAVGAERRYYGLHLAAMWGRVQAAARVDTAAGFYGQLVGWHTVRDQRTSAECLAADGKNFYAGAMPLIGYPGAVHPHCRCTAGHPFTGARLLPSGTNVAAPAPAYRLRVAA